LEVSSALAFLHGRTLHPMELALLCQRAERNFVGMPCGIMDQYISVFGRSNCAVEIDCRSLGHRLVALPAGITFVAVNTMVKHALASSAYRERVAECAAAVDGLRQQFPGVESLRDATPEQLAAVAPQALRSGGAPRPPRRHGGRPGGPLCGGQRGRRSSPRWAD
jgi:galactokinase